MLRRISWLSLSVFVVAAIVWCVWPQGPVIPSRTALALWAPREPAVVTWGPSAGGRAPKFLARSGAASAVTPVSIPANLRLVAEQRLVLPLPDGRRIAGTVHLVRTRPAGSWVAGGRLDDGGTFTLAAGGGAWAGVVLPARGDLVYRLFTADDGGAALAAVPRESVLCASLPPGPRPTAGARIGGAAGGGAAATQALPVPVLNSRPDAEAVIYLDFDGATVTDPFWNGGQTIVAAESGLADADIELVWRRVAEDYRPFNINVTTDAVRYAAARPMQRMRCIITATSAWFGDYGGVAALSSWPHAGVGLPYYEGEVPFEADIPCWAFADQNFGLGEYIALAVSHEVGHTLGLSHDGLKGTNGVTTDEYYDGHGAGASSWGPIMGAPYGRALIQWSHGDYASGVLTANNQEDDIAIVAGIENHTGFAPERRAATLAEAGRLAVSADGTTVDHHGLIETGGAESWLLVAAGAGSLSLRLAVETPEDPDAMNVDGALTLTDLAGVTLATASVEDGRFPTLATILPAAGAYVLRVRSVGQGSATAGGYSAYGSAGRFRVQGSVTAPAGVGPIMGGASRVEGRVGEALVYPIEAAGAGLGYAATGLPAGLAAGADGRVTGVPTEAGVFSVDVTTANASGTAGRTVVFAVAAADLAAVLDAPELVFATGGDRPWRGVSEGDAPAGGSAARSGEILDAYQQSWIETAVTGPGRLTWRWKVSSEDTYDFFNVKEDGVTKSSISGETNWAAGTLNLAAGAHTIRWTYDKDPFLAVGRDAAWLDDVRWARGFELWAESAALTGPAAAAGADSDGDGVANLLEYALALDPGASTGLGATVQVEPSADALAGGALELVFTRPAGREDLRYVVEVSGNLITWAQGHAYGSGVNNGAGLPTVEVARDSLPGGGELIRVRDAVGPGGGTPRRFIRLRVERIAP